jgi:2-keto-3-deoxy-6-phosphogluconate aldolase
MSRACVKPAAPDRDAARRRRVVREAKRHAMICLPGVATPTEAFAALAAGADG